MAEISGKLNGAKEDVYFLEHVNYYDMVAQGHFMDITDLVANDVLDEYGENVTIESKMHEKVKDVCLCGWSVNPQKARTRSNRPRAGFLYHSIDHSPSSAARGNCKVILVPFPC